MSGCVHELPGDGDIIRMSGFFSLGGLLSAEGWEWRRGRTVFGSDVEIPGNIFTLQ